MPSGTRVARHALSVPDVRHQFSAIPGGAQGRDRALAVGIGAARAAAAGLCRCAWGRLQGVTKGLSSGPHANGAPGRGAVAMHCLPRYQACTSSFVGQAAASACAGVGAKTSPAFLAGKPLVAGHAWVPGCRARTFRCP